MELAAGGRTSPDWQANGLIDPDFLDPCPDIHALFCHYNDLYFHGSLGATSVDWSTARMTLCAGVCHYAHKGGCRIRLSEPLLKYRPPSDLKETLLHEMIHAYLFLSERNTDHDDHGPHFQSIKNSINSSSCEDPQRPSGGYHISIYHSFKDEVDIYRRHHWQCDRCQHEVRRAMNRPPSAADCRLRSPAGRPCGDPRCSWHRHEAACGGSFVKTAEPEGYAVKGKRKREEGATGGVKRKSEEGQTQAGLPITKFFHGVVDDAKERVGQSVQQGEATELSEKFPLDARAGRVESTIGSAQNKEVTLRGARENSAGLQSTSALRKSWQAMGSSALLSEGLLDKEEKLPGEGSAMRQVDKCQEESIPGFSQHTTPDVVTCPVCGLLLPTDVDNDQINAHVDACLQGYPKCVSGLCCVLGAMGYVLQACT